MLRGQESIMLPCATIFQRPFRCLKQHRGNPWREGVCVQFVLGKRHNNLKSSNYTNNKC